MGGAHDVTGVSAAALVDRACRVRNGTPTTEGKEGEGERERERGRERMEEGRDFVCDEHNYIDSLNERARESETEEF